MNVTLRASEGLFGWATEEELQPNVDGLSRDEILLSSVLTTLIVVLEQDGTRGYGEASSDSSTGRSARLRRTRKTRRRRGVSSIAAAQQAGA